MHERRLNPVKKIFISSPSDTRQERLKAQTVVRKLAREFSHYFIVEPVLWEREPLKATQHFQADLKPHETDIVVVILWSRLGTPLPLDKYPGPMTGRQVTGTEWEFEDAFASYREKQRPDLLLYRKNADIVGSLKDDAVVEQKLQQRRALEDFMQRWFIDTSNNTLKLALHDFTDTTDFEQTLETHLRGLLDAQLDEAKKIDVHWHKGSPFRGLESFDLEHAPVFFGRVRARNEVRALLEKRINAGCAFVLVLGASGCGKSSLIKSGLLAELKEPGMIGPVALCRHAILRPADAPDNLLKGLANALLHTDALPELSGLNYDAITLAEQLRGTPNQVVLPIRQALEVAVKQSDLTARAEARVVLIIDQMEELFTIDGLTSEERKLFVSTLEELARSQLVWVIAAMRSDFFDRLEHLPQLAQMSRESYHLAFPDDAEITQIIRQPALEAGLHFEYKRDLGYGLDDELIKAASLSPSSLPLLEFTLDQLWHSRSEKGDLTFAAYQDLGGLEGALGRRAEEEFSRLPADVQAALPQVLRALSTVDQNLGSEVKVTARSATFAELSESNPVPRLVKAFLDPHSRLLVSDGDDKAGRIRVSHEALLTHWERARNQLTHDRDDLQVRSRLEQASSIWDATPTLERDDRLLSPGLPLLEAEDLLKRRRSELDGKVIAYIKASASAAQARIRRSRITFAGISVLVAIAVILFVLFHFQKRTTDQEHKIALSRLLATQAALLADQAPDDKIVERAAALAIESWNLVHNVEASTAAEKLLRMLPTYRLQHDDTVMSVAFSKDGLLMATGSKDKKARVFETSGNELFNIEHDDTVYSVDFSPKRRLLASGSADKTVRLTELASRKEIFRQRQEGQVSKVVFSPDGRLLATAGSDRTARLIDINGLKELRQINHGGKVMHIAFSPDGGLLATGSKDKLARIIDTATGNELFRVAHAGAVIHLAFSHDNQFLATASEDKMARMIKVSTGKVVLPIDHKGTVRSVAFSPDNQWLAAGSDDKSASITNIKNRMEVPNIFHKKEVFSVRFSANGRFFATSGADNTVKLIDTRSWDEVTRIMHGGPAWKIAFSPDRDPDSRFLLTASSDRIARLIETPATQEIVQLDADGRVNSIAFAPKGKLLAAGSADNKARLIEYETGKELTVITHDDEVYAVAFSFDSQFWATASKDTTRLIETASGKEKTRIVHPGEIRTIAFSPDNRWLATGGLDKSVKLIETASGKEARQINHGDAIYSVVFSFDSKLLAMAGKDGVVNLIDPQTGEIKKSIKLPAIVSRLAFSPDGRLLATASEDGMARLIDTSTGKERANYKHIGAVHHVAFSPPDGRLLATGSEDNSVRLIEISNGKEIGRILHGGKVTSMAFRPDGLFLATGSEDSTSRLIETNSGHEVARTNHKNMVYAVAFSSPDGKWLATGDRDGQLRMTDAEPQHVFDNLCKKKGRNLDQDERQDYLGIEGPHLTCKAWRTPVTGASQ